MFTTYAAIVLFAIATIHVVEAIDGKRKLNITDALACALGIATIIAA